MVALTVPGLTMPMPTARPPPGLPPPATTGVPAARPVASAPARTRRPVTADPSWTAGRLAASMPTCPISSDDQRRPATSKSRVPEASAASVARSPVSRHRT